MSRKLGRFAYWHTDPKTKVTTARTEDGLWRVYTEDEMAEAVVSLCEQMLDSPNQVDESWLEFIRSVVGAEAIETSLTLVTEARTQGLSPLPPGLRMELQ